MALLGALLLAGGAGARVPAPRPSGGRPPPDGLLVRVALRASTIEALPLAIVQRTAADRQAGLRLGWLDVGAGDPLAPLGDRADAAIATSTDLLSARRPDVEDAFNFFERAPVAIVADAPDQPLAGLVLAADASSGTLSARLARSLLRAPSPPRFVPGGSWFGVLATYAAGQVDGALGVAPLPQYLAGVYGGGVVWDASEEADSPPVGAGSLLVPAGMPPATRERLVALLRQAVELLAVTAPEELAELVADAYPRWEPDAVLEAVRVAKRCLNHSGRLGARAARRAAELMEEEPPPGGAASSGSRG